jgi:ammonium transporter, Amt family
VRRKLLTGAAFAAAGVIAFASPAGAQEVEEVAESVGELGVLLDNLFVFLAGVLVFLMQAGFSLLEAGLTRAKNVANIMMKNLTDMSAGVLAFFLVGWSIAYDGTEWLGGWSSISERSRRSLVQIGATL